MGCHLLIKVIWEFSQHMDHKIGPCIMFRNLSFNKTFYKLCECLLTNNYPSRGPTAHPEGSTEPPVLGGASFREIFLQFPSVFIMTLKQHTVNNQSLLNYIPGNWTRLDFVSFKVFSNASSFGKKRGPWFWALGEFLSSIGEEG